MKQSCYATLFALGIVPVIKIENAEDAVPLCRSLFQGGLPLAEITFRTEAAAEALRQVRAALPEMLVGAGTVTSTDMARTAMECGARFIVSPGFSHDIVRWCLERDIPVIPGCATASEVEAAMNLGLDLVKFFPAEQCGGMRTIQALSGPYPAMRFMPTGGISLHNLAEYLASPLVVACGGSFITPADRMAAKDWEGIRALAAQAASAAQGMALAQAGPCLLDSTHIKEVATEFAVFIPGAVGEISASGGPAWRIGPVVAKTTGGAAFHMAFSTTCLERTLAWLLMRGITVDEGAVRRAADGKAQAATLREPVGSCEVSFLQR
jgi:Entner-Doudoroff aldolase